MCRKSRESKIVAVITSDYSNHNLLLAHGFLMLILRISIGNIRLEWHLLFHSHWWKQKAHLAQLLLMLHSSTLTYVMFISVDNSHVFLWTSVGLRVASYVQPKKWTPQLRTNDSTKALQKSATLLAALLTPYQCQ